MYTIAQFGDSLYLMVMTDSDPNWRPIAMFVSDAPEEVRERALEMCAVLNGDLDADGGIEVVTPREATAEDAEGCVSATEANLDEAKPFPFKDEGLGIGPVKEGELDA